MKKLILEKVPSFSVEKHPCCSQSIEIDIEITSLLMKIKKEI